MGLMDHGTLPIGINGQKTCSVASTNNEATDDPFQI